MNLPSFLNKVPRALWPKTLASQLIILLLAAIFMAQLISFLVFQDERRNTMLTAARDNIVQRSVTVADLLEDTPEPLQSRILEASSSRFAVFWIGDTPLAAEPGDSRPEAHWQAIINSRLRDGQEAYLNISTDNLDDYRNREFRDNQYQAGNAERERNWRDIPRNERPRNLRRIMNKPVDLSLSIHLTDGRWLNVATSYRPPASALIPLLAQILLTSLAAILIVGFVVRRVARPLKDLAVATEKFGRGEEVEPLRQSGPKEVRSLTGSFNDMQDRLSRFVQDRTRMLAAISHDLRTPITSLRLRAEFIDDDENREKMIETLDEMAAMPEATLRFAKNEAVAEKVTETDIGALLELLAEDQTELGHTCHIDIKTPLSLPCRPLALKRALRNLIENGIRYGEEVSVSLERTDKNALITIQDKGPGIPEDKLKDVFEPFVRLDESRNEETGGIGLGLAITRSIIHAHGGIIALENKEEGGLQARVELPL